MWLCGYLGSRDAEEGHNYGIHHTKCHQHQRQSQCQAQYGPTANKQVHIKPRLRNLEFKYSVGGFPLIGRKEKHVSPSPSPSHHHHHHHRHHMHDLTNCRPPKVPRTDCRCPGTGRTDLERCCYRRRHHHCHPWLTSCRRTPRENWPVPRAMGIAVELFGRRWLLLWRSQGYRSGWCCLLLLIGLDGAGECELDAEHGWVWRCRCR